MPIKKPANFGGTYLWYNMFTAIIVLACHAKGTFIYINAGRPVGNLYTYWHSVMCQKGASGEWLAHAPRTIDPFKNCTITEL